jgi:hypothetical protein
VGKIVFVVERDEFLAGIIEHSVFGAHPDTSETILADAGQVCLGKPVPARETGMEMMRLDGK